MTPRENIILVGMPGAGKSTVGVILAKQTGRDLVDTDVLIQLHTERSLQNIVDRDGYMRLREIEEEILLSLSLDHHVIATGGSAVYSEKAMRHLKTHGVVVFLEVPYSTIVSRVHDFETRGIARRPDQSFAELFEERSALYQKYADLRLPCGDMTQENVSREIVARL